MPATHFLLIAIICLAWGGNFLFSALALRHFPPLSFTALRLVVVLACLAPQLRWPPAAMRGRVVAIALLWGALHFGINFTALRMAGDVSSVAIALQSYIPMSALLARLLLDEPIGRRTGAGIAVAFGGVFVLGFDPLVLDAPGALLLTVLAAFCLALATTLMRGLVGVGPFAMQAWTALLGIPVLLAAIALLERDQLGAVATASWRDWGGVLYSAIFGSLVGHGLMAWLLVRHPVSQVTPYLLLTPVVAMGLGVLFFGDRPGPSLLAGGAMVLFGVGIVALREVAPQRAA